VSLIKTKKLQKSYGSLPVLSDVSFSLARGQKAALVGHNGTGKTTLLKILAGLEEADAGVLEIARDARIGYLPQDADLSGSETVSSYLRRTSGVDALEREVGELAALPETPAKARRQDSANRRYVALDGYAFNRRMEVMLRGFGLDGAALARPVSDLSSGQRSKVALAGILLKGADLLLLDEPTNNLDLPALIWLEDFLESTEAACIIVSHDRRFLDRVVRKIFELDWRTHSLTATAGTYSDYLEMGTKRLARQKEDYRLQRDEVARLEERAREKRAASARGTKWGGTDNDKFLRGFNRNKAGKSASVAKAIEKRIEHIHKVEKPIEREPLEIRLEAATSSPALDIRLDDVLAGYPEGFRLGPVSLEIRYGSRVGIIGLNGSGKSTLLKTITGELLPLGGKIEIGSGVRIGNMMQEHETLPRGSTPLELLAERAGLAEERAFAQLSKFGLDERQARLAVGTLSPGGRARLLLALFSALSVNVLVLDEPTNHLDLESLQALEETLATYRGTVLLVSHDRYFLEKATLGTTYVLADGVFSRIPDYRTYVAAAEESARKLRSKLPQQR